MTRSREEANLSPYPSSMDLPSFRALSKQLEGLKLLAGVIAPSRRGEVVRLEEQLKEITEAVEAFYERLGPRHWICHESLNADDMHRLVATPVDEAERGLIEYYKDPVHLRYMIGQIQQFEAMSERLVLVERARDDYEQGRYYSTVLVLFAVMDGFVNDVQVDRRRGLHTRTSDELVAWDSIVGHHMGLTNAHETFTANHSKRSTEPVHELYRNGIVHGVLVNFDNDIIATKAWNRLFAIVDWARSLDTRAQPDESHPSLNEMLRERGARAQAQKAADAARALWKAHRMSAADASAGEEPVYLASAEYLDAWRNANYGRMATLASVLMREGSVGATAGAWREMYEEFVLTDFAIEALDFTGPAVCQIDVMLTIGDQILRGRMRWNREDDDGTTVAPNEAGAWHLISVGPSAILEYSAEDE